MRILYVLLGLMLVGCGPDLQTENKDEIERWEGQPVDRLVYKWGAPDSTHKMQNGRTVMTFENEIMEERYSTDEYGHRYLSHIERKTCRVDWFTDPARTYIVSGKSSGDPEACHELIVPL